MPVEETYAQIKKRLNRLYDKQKVELDKPEEQRDQRSLTHYRIAIEINERELVKARERDPHVRILLALADSFECFWNPAVEAVRNDGYAEQAALQAVGAMAQGFAAMAARMRQHAEGEA